MLSHVEFDRFAFLFFKRQEDILTEEEADEYYTLLIRIVRGF